MTKQQRLVVVISILASFVAFLDGSIVNVALPAITKELGGGLAAQQWIVDAYLLTLGSLILLAGSLSDIFGRAKVLAAGLIGFAAASLFCAVAPDSTFLIIVRGVQGLAGALIVPSSLALIMSNFSGSEEGHAIGIWTGWTGISFIVGPLLGGFLIDAGSWRWIFAINLLPIVITLGLLRQLAPTKNSKVRPRIDSLGAFLGILGLGGPVYALIEQPHYGWAQPQIYLPLVLGLLALGLFVHQERTTAQPMLPLELFKNRNFSVGNVATVAIYGGLSVSTFLIIIFIQQIGHYSALRAGMSLIPVTLLMFFLSGRFGKLAGKFGPRLFMSLGPIVAGSGFLLLLRVNEQVHYWSQLFPGIFIFGVGLSLTVAPLTTAILGSIGSQRAGIASAVNNAVSRIAGLVAIALIGIVTGADLRLAGFHRGVIVMSALLFTGGIISAIGIQNKKKPTTPK
jgi:EmrB/QacA subfamily drug resistance transporter